MKGYYDITTTIKTALLADNDVTTVTMGSINSIDVSKQTMFPLSHLMVDNALYEGAVLRFNINLELLDIVDISNDQTNDRFSGNDNEVDIHNTQLAVGVRLLARFERGDLFTNEYALDGEPNFEKLSLEYENGLSGWRLTFDILYKHDMTIC